MDEYLGDNPFTAMESFVRSPCVYCNEVRERERGFNGIDLTVWILLLDTLNLIMKAVVKSAIVVVLITFRKKITEQKKKADGNAHNLKYLTDY